MTGLNWSAQWLLSWHCTISPLSSPTFNANACALIIWLYCISLTSTELSALDHLLSKRFTVSLFFYWQAPEKWHWLVSHSFKCHYEGNNWWINKQLLMLTVSAAQMCCGSFSVWLCPAVLQFVISIILHGASLGAKSLNLIKTQFNLDACVYRQMISFHVSS